MIIDKETQSCQPHDHNHLFTFLPVRAVKGIVAGVYNGWLGILQGVPISFNSNQTWLKFGDTTCTGFVWEHGYMPACLQHLASMYANFCRRRRE